MSTLSRRYTVHALRGTLVPSSHLKARQIDQLPPEEREEWLREWRNLKELCASFPGISASTVSRDPA